MTSIDVTATTADAETTMTVNGSVVVSGQAKATALNVGDNRIAVQVTAEDGITQKNYGVTVTRATYGSADLSGLTLSAGTLSPAFNTATTSYTASVGNEVASIDVMATTADAETTMTVNGSAVVSGQAKATALNVGDNTITVQVTAKDGITQNNYGITVTRATYGSADLSGLTLSAGTLSPAFNTATTSYTASVGNEVTSIDVTLTTADAETTMTVNGLAVVSGQAKATALNVGNNTITVQVMAKDGIAQKSYTVMVTRANKTDNGNNENNGNSGGTQVIVNTDTYRGILVNGKVVNAGTITTSRRNEQTVTTITIDPNKLAEMLKQSGERSVVTISFNNRSDVLIAELDGLLIQMMEENHAELEIKSEIAGYRIPAQQVNIDAIVQQVGMSVALKDIKIQVEIASLITENVKFIEDVARDSNITLIVPPLDFTVRAIYGNHQVEIPKFDAFVERLIAIPDSIDPNRITTGVVVDLEGTVRHVPTKIIMIEGKYYAVINSLTNSIYSVVWNQLEFTDVEKHWAKEAINNMGSRMIVSGKGSGIFSPDQDVTRAELAAIIVRGLGLRLEQGESAFSDVKVTDWYSSSIQTAYEYGLINGFEEGTFRPNDKITREQAMLILSKAMDVTGLSGQNVSQNVANILSAFSDTHSISNWALNGAAQSVSAGIINGRSSELLASKAYISRAEVAVIVQRLLQKSKLIDE